MDPDWVDVFPINNGDIPASYVIVYRSVSMLGFRGVLGGSSQDLDTWLITMVRFRPLNGVNYSPYKWPNFPWLVNRGDPNHVSVRPGMDLQVFPASIESRGDLVESQESLAFRRRELLQVAGWGWGASQLSNEKKNLVVG